MLELMWAMVEQKSRCRSLADIGPSPVWTHSLTPAQAKWTEHFHLHHETYTTWLMILLDTHRAADCVRIVSLSHCGCRESGPDLEAKYQHTARDHALQERNPPAKHLPLHVNKTPHWRPFALHIRGSSRGCCYKMPSPSFSFIAYDVEGKQSRWATRYQPN
jgi:hypothetical protein